VVAWLFGSWTAVVAAAILLWPRVFFVALLAIFALGLGRQTVRRLTWEKRLEHARELNGRLAGGLGYPPDIAFPRRDPRRSSAWELRPGFVTALVTVALTLIVLAVPAVARKAVDHGNPEAKAADRACEKEHAAMARLRAGPALPFGGDYAHVRIEANLFRDLQGARSSAQRSQAYDELLGFKSAEIEALQVLADAVRARSRLSIDHALGNVRHENDKFREVAFRLGARTCARE
jgi:hypothetical protein